MAGEIITGDCLSCLTVGLGCVAGSLLFGFLYWMEEWT